LIVTDWAPEEAGAADEDEPADEDAPVPDDELDEPHAASTAVRRAVRTVRATLRRLVTLSPRCDVRFGSR
jgi:hypothetical protein